MVNLEAKARQCLKEFDLRTLFIEEMGWDRHISSLEVFVDGLTYTLSAVAQKRGLVVFACSSASDGLIPDYSTRRRIEKQVAKSVHEHLIIYTNKSNQFQIWQWVKREAGKPTQCREHRYYCNQPGDSLLQKLEAIAFSLDEEEGLTIVDVASRIRAGFDIDRVTKRFYDRFKSEHDAFLKFLKGIPDEEMQRWYVSVMLNRLMFIYFVQKKGFLDNNINYLRDKLTETKTLGKDRFYKDFLCPLFFEGFAKKKHERKATINQLLGRVPFLNGGIFQPHQLEELYGKSIHIVDAAFEKLFSFFEQYQWHLDERPLRKDNEINPDVLGYIFEKYVNQKQMGAYYTKEDITEYISKNTILPYLFDEAKKKCRIAFEGERSFWCLLQADPDRYIYDALKKGVDLPLPAEIAGGLNDVSKRTEWNNSASEEYALPAEIWREVVERRNRYEELRAKLANRGIQDIGDLITYNLNIRQFAQDVIENCEEPELLRAFWHTIEQVSILDPTCGSGAFLFAALNILEPLYEACLERMEVFLDELARSGEEHRPEKFSDFRTILERIEKHPSRRYYIFKSIIVNNLYGVDIMEEAIEICKLRLFLKLVAQIEKVENIEPLPDIDFNIRAGNTLVGYSTYDEVKKAVLGDTQGKLDLGKDMERINEKAQDVDRLFTLFRQQQTELGGEVTINDKQELRKRLKALEDELNRYLAGEYRIDPDKKPSYEKWLVSHKPFHWFIEFYGIVHKRGGFNAIIGNPPYVELSDVVNDYSIRGLELVKTGNLFSICTERFVDLLDKNMRVGIIVPISSVSTPRMLPLMKLLKRELSLLHISNFAVRPGKLFVGTDMNLSILIGKKGISEDNKKIYSTSYNRWEILFRSFLFDTLAFSETNLDEKNYSIPKLGSKIDSKLLLKLSRFAPLARHRSMASDSERVYYHSGGRYFRKCIRKQLSNEYKELRVKKEWAEILICLLSSSLYYWFWIAISDCYHVTKRDIDTLPVPESLKEDTEIENLADTLLKDLWENAQKRIRNRADGSTQTEVNFNVAKSKHIIDVIDRLMARHYGFTENEEDFLINYDIKYRTDDES
jgi:hypothetical protein